MADLATSSGATAALAQSQASGSELVALKQQVDRLRGDLTPGKTGQQKLRKACTDFEAVFISKMWEQMRATVPKEGYLHSPQEDMYRSMFDRDFAEKLANDGGIGLGDMMYSQLKDKLKNAVKSTATDGAASAEGGAKALKPLRPETVEVPLDQRPALNPLRAANQGIVLDRKAAVAEKTRTQPAATQGPAAQAPQRPASVPGDVMGEVEALARRIEEDYARRQQAGGYGRSGGAVQTTGRKLAAIG